MIKLLKHIVEKLVDKVEEVRINELAGDATIVLEVKVSKCDVGKVIGKSGRTAEAIRTVINCAAAKENKRYILQIVDGEEL